MGDGAIYGITCLANGKIYIGRTAHPETRYKDHFYALRAGRHYNKELQDDWNRYGKELFSFKILSHSIDFQAEYAEEEMIAQYKSYLPAFGYNTKDRRFTHKGREKIRLPIPVKIEAMCREHNISISELENKLKVSPGFIARITPENISVAGISRIAEQFGVEAHDLLRRCNCDEP